MSKVEYLFKDNFSEATAEGVVLVDFFATWCGPCKMLGPELDELSTKTEHKVFKVDVDENKDLSREYRVMSVPTMLIFKDGEMVKRIVGFKEWQELKDELDALSN